MSFRADDEVPEAIRWRTYQTYPNPIYEMGSNLGSWETQRAFVEISGRWKNVVEKQRNYYAREFAKPKWPAASGHIGNL